MKKNIILIALISLIILCTCSTVSAWFIFGGEATHECDYFKVAIPDGFDVGTNSGKSPSYSGYFVYFWSDDDQSEDATILVSIDNNTQMKNKILNDENITILKNTTQNGVNIYVTNDSFGSSEPYKVYAFFNKDGVSYYISIDYDIKDKSVTHDDTQFKKEIDWIMGLYNSLEKTN